MGVARAGRSTPGSAPSTIFGSGHRRARVAGGHKALGLSITHQLQPHAHRAVFLGPARLRGLLLHADALRGMVDDDRQVFIFKVFIKQIAQFRLRPDQMNAHRKCPSCEDRSPDLGFGCFIGTYCIKRDVDEHGGSGLHLLATWQLL